jgi:hypothetical protein
MVAKCSEAKWSAIFPLILGAHLKGQSDRTPQQMRAYKQAFIRIKKSDETIKTININRSAAVAGLRGLSVLTAANERPTDDSSRQIPSAGVE